MNPKYASHLVAGLLAASAVVWLVGCNSPTSPNPIALQFRSGQHSPSAVSAMSVEGGPAVVRIVGGYVSAACGVPGGKAQRDGNVLKLDVGPGVTGPLCDLARTAYNYDASLIGVEPGRYAVEVYHRADPTVRELAYSAVVTVQ